jgi:hypothetical protein
LEALANSGEKFRLIKVDVARWGSPVAEQFNLNSLPSFLIYDDKGQLKAQGEAARKQVYGQYLSDG